MFLLSFIFQRSLEKDTLVLRNYRNSVLTGMRSFIGRVRDSSQICLSCCCASLRKAHSVKSKKTKKYRKF